MRTVRFGIIGCGLMGREFASATARWCHLIEPVARPELVAVCDTNPALLPWYREHFLNLRQFTSDYRALLANRDVEAVYVAVPHHLHQQIYCAAIRAGKHLMGEKPFGIDRRACQAIHAAACRHPQQLVRCSSESPFFPAMQLLCELFEPHAFGQILEANTGFLHSSDLDPNKPINWKRQLRFNGEYGVLGDLGLHALHIPFRAGWRPDNVRAILSNVVTQRPDARGQLVPCDTWDNATLLIETLDSQSGALFPWTVKLQRIAPGHKNTWYTEILGTRASVRWSSENPRLLQILRYTPGGSQNWQHIQTGHETAFKTVTGPIFEFGFSDSILQMWAAFLYELTQGQPLKKFAGCVTPEEAGLSHRLFTAALRSQRRGVVVNV
jgi:predicted dehydrogenase